MHRNTAVFALVVFGLGFSACNSKQGQSKSAEPANSGTVQAAGYDTSAATDDGEWTRAAKDYANTRFSTLDQINTGNVKDLKLAWTFSTGVTKGHEAAPLVVNGTMYVVTPYPNILYALDLSKPGAPAKWTYKPQV